MLESPEAVADTSRDKTPEYDRPYNLLECPVCLERLTIPVTSTCRNGHAVCNICKLKVTVCPTCRTAMINTKNILIDKVIEITSFPCKNKIFGCIVKGKYKEIMDHETNECDYKTIPCSLLNDEIEKCGKSVTLFKFYSHIIKDHANLLEKITANQENVRKICSTNHEFFKVQNILQDHENNLIFIETCFYDKQKNVFFLSYQYVGRMLESKKYVCTSTFYDPYHKLKKLKYVNFCLPIGMDVKEMPKDPRCLVIHPDKVIIIKEGIVEVNHIVKIEKYEDYDSRKHKKIKLENPDQ